MANDMMLFFTGLMDHTATWLMSEPIKYFTAIFLGAGVVGIVKRLMNISK